MMNVLSGVMTQILSDVAKDIENETTETRAFGTVIDGDNPPTA